MSDTYGSATLPLATVATSSVTITPNAFDPLLDYLASYLKTIANARLLADWILKAPNTLPVKEAFPFSPDEGHINDRDLPALFVYRTGSKTRLRLADGYRIDRSTVSLLYVPQLAPMQPRDIRMAFPNELFKLWDAVLESGRDRSWIVAGDADVNAVSLGSSLGAYTKTFRLEVGMWARTPITVSMDDGPPRVYFASTTTIDLEEHLTVDVAIYDTLAGFNFTEHTEDGGVGDGGVVLDVSDNVP